MEQPLKTLKKGNDRFIDKFKGELKKHIAGQSPKVAVLTCSDSRVVPEFIFDASIGQLFVIRVAGNVAMDPSVLTSLEYAVDHLNVDYIIILGHTNCGAVKASEETKDSDNQLIHEIQESFTLDPTDHIMANLKRQLSFLPKRSRSINNAIREKKVQLQGAIYHLEDGTVEFIE